MEQKPINLSHNMLGCRFDNWMRLKRENVISPENKKQARFITAVSFALGLPAFLEWAIFNRKIKNTSIDKGPVYIVGHWRTGTTFLQNLMTRDPQFGWFDPVKTVTFNNCILLGKPLAKVQESLLKEARPFDNMDYKLDLPMEEVFAQATLSTQAISHMLVFPDGGNGTKFIETAFIDEQSKAKQEEWFQAYDYILKKVTYLCKGKQLLLKSPENTCRILELKRRYPKAKFINIYRNPYKVVMSTANMFKKEMNLLCLSTPATDEFIEDTIIELFQRIYHKAIADLEAIPAEDRIDIKYEDFVKEPKAYLEEIYQHLGLDGYEEALPYFNEHLDSQKNYKTNTFHLDERLKKRINENLGFYFEYYGYEMED